MSHYRNITVDDKDYRFNIGKKFIDIRTGKGKEIVSKSEIGFANKYNEYIVTPKMIADYIRGHTRPIDTYFETCSCKDVSKSLGVKPFDNEIKDKKLYVYWCENCYDRNLDDI